MNDDTMPARATDVRRAIRSVFGTDRKNVARGASMVAAKIRKICGIHKEYEPPPENLRTEDPAVVSLCRKHEIYVRGERSGLVVAEGKTFNNWRISRILLSGMDRRESLAFEALVEEAREIYPSGFSVHVVLKVPDVPGKYFLVSEGFPEDDQRVTGLRFEIHEDAESIGPMWWMQNLETCQIECRD